MTLILGCDPGKKSGLAVYNTTSCDVEFMEESDDGVRGFVPSFTAMYCYYRPDFVVCESFNLRPGNQFLADLSGVESIGWLKGEGYKVEYVIPAAHKTLVKDRVLTPLMKDAGFPVGAGHTRDGLRTAVWFAAKKMKHEQTLRLLSGEDN